MQTVEACPLCNASAAQLFIRCTDYTVSQKEFDIVRCGQCNFLYTNPRPTEEEIGQYYLSEDYISHSDTQKGLINTLYHYARKYTLQQKSNLICKSTGLTKGKILDYGCGTGAFIHKMQTLGWEVTGLEPSPQAQAFAAQNYGLQLAEPDTLATLVSESYDALTMWHVLEHVHRLHDTLSALTKVLKPRGVFFIAVPNATAYDAQHYGRYWAAYDVPRHLYHFTSQTMQDLLARHQLKIQAQQWMPLDAFYVSLLSEKYKTGKSNIIAASWHGLQATLKAYANLNLASSVLYRITKY